MITSRTHSLFTKDHAIFLARTNRRTLRASLSFFSADLSKQNIFEPLAVKEQVINSATEAACRVLRIDDVIAASKPQRSEGPAGCGGRALVEEEKKKWAISANSAG